jgi:hypothetical protein
MGWTPRPEGRERKVADGCPEGRAPPHKKKRVCPDFGLEPPLQFDGDEISHLPFVSLGETFARTKLPATR